MKNSRVIPYLCPWAAAVLSLCSGGAPALPRPREKAEEAWPDVLELSVATACTGKRQARRIEDGGRRRRDSMAGGGAGQGGEVEQG
jgi:hypothetical protein